MFGLSALAALAEVASISRLANLLSPVECALELVLTALTEWSLFELALLAQVGSVSVISWVNRVCGIS